MKNKGVKKGGKASFNGLRIKGLRREGRQALMKNKGVKNGGKARHEFPLCKL